MPDTAPSPEVAPLQLLGCARGHYWETEAAPDGGPRQTVCPTCGAPPDGPLLDLENADTPLPATLTPLPPPYQDRTSKPIVAGYEILDDLGRTGAGVVQYRARQTVLNRLVVLKTVLARDDPSQQAWGALRGEAAALAKLPHPNIVGIFEAGDRERQLFYNAVEFVEGPPLATLLADKRLAVPQALALVEVLARAVHFAHEQGVVHRGLRPKTILLQVQRTDKKSTATPEPLTCGVHAVRCIPKITGYGLARARLVEGDVTDHELQDKFPCYLSPEQAWGRSKEIGPATDVYALGAILYECLTGQPPFKGSSPGTTLEQIQSIDPLPIATLRRGVPADVAAIARKCLHKQPRRRYSSALELADDLRRAATGRTVQARSVNFLVRGGKWARRNVLAFVALVAVVLGSLGAFWAWTSGENKVDRARRETLRVQAEHNATLTRLSEQSRQVEFLQNVLQMDYYIRELNSVERELERRNFPGATRLLQSLNLNLRNAEWYLLRQRALGKEPQKLGECKWPVASLVWSGDGQSVAAAAGDFRAFGAAASRGAVYAWNAADGSAWPHFPQESNTPAQQVAFSADGKHLLWLTPDELTVWNRATAAVVYTVGKSVLGQCTAFCCAPDGHTVLLTKTNGLLYTLDADSGRFVVPARWVGNNPTAIVALNADGSNFALATADQPHTVNVYEGHNVCPLALDDNVAALAYHAESARLAIGGGGGLRLWQTVFNQGNKSKLLMEPHPGGTNEVVGLAFSHDGKRLATCGDRDGTIHILDVATAQQVYSFRIPGPVTALAFNPKDYRLAVAADKAVFILGAER